MWSGRCGLGRWWFAKNASVNCCVIVIAAVVVGNDVIVVRMKVVECVRVPRDK